MNIYGKIVTAMVAFEHWTGKRPGLVYAGEDEVEELKAWACDSFPLVGAGESRISGSEVAGLEIVEVKDKSFLSVGIKV